MADLEAYKLATSVDDVPLTSAVLAAGARHLGEYCAKQNKDFLKCKFEAQGDPKPCLQKGAQVTLCALDL
jgi:NADH dehydrogenase (ubiquinone) 1 alpha subcomplex subunit 8